MKLRLTGPESQTRDMDIIAEPQTIGRSPDCDLILQDRTISRRHCEVRLAEEVVFIEDLNSRYGITINGEVRQGEEVQLRLGEELELGCWTGGIVDEVSGEIGGLPTVEMEMTVAQTPSSTRKTRLLKRQESRRPRGYLVLLFALAAIGGVVLAYFLLDTP
jgi:predicted component of type VI protein secretion system